MKHFLSEIVGLVMLCAAPAAFSDPLWMGITSGGSVSPAHVQSVGQPIAGRSYSLRITLESSLIEAPLLSRSSLDADHDGVDDLWERWYFGGLTHFSGSFSDWDLDGFADLDEYLAGTDPQSPQSALLVRSNVVASGGASFHIASVPGRVYHLFRSPDLRYDSWQVCATATSVSHNVVLSDAQTSTMSRAFYRAAVVGAPPGTP